MGEGLKNWSRLLQTVQEDDIIFIHSSGDFGTLFYWTNMVNRSWHDYRRKLILQFPDNKIVQLPVTVFYHATEGGKNTLEKDRRFYKNQKNLVLTCREPDSHQILASNLDCRTMMVPDFAFNLKPKLTEKERNGALLILRRDHETLFGNKRVQIKKMIEMVTANVTVRDVNWYAKRPLTDRIRAGVINRILDYYQNFKVVVTDRLHGMIFSVITRTPCVCIRDRIPHKSSGYRSLLNDSVEFIDKITEIPDAIRNVLSKPFQKVDLTSHFRNLKEKVV